MATRLYLRSTTSIDIGQGNYGTAPKSIALPVGTNLLDNIPAVNDLSTTPGLSQASRVGGNTATTDHYDNSTARYISPALADSSIDANTWTLAIALKEAHVNANFQLCASLYVLQDDDTIRGFIYDSHDLLGVEPGTTELGQVISLTGSAVAGVVPTDRLALEIWHHEQASSATQYSTTHYFDGATDVTTSTTTDAASYIETPQDLAFTVVLPEIEAISGLLVSPV
jgi:hypothetical protein